MINLATIANLLVTTLLGNSGLIEKLLGMGRSGSSPNAIMDFLEQQKPEVKNHEMWQAMRGKSEQEIEEYGLNLAKSLGLNKQQ